MAITTFNGPVSSQNGFIGGTATEPITVTTAQNISSFYGTASNTTGDTRLSYNRLTFTSTGSGETIRALTRVTGANAATGGTVNGAHISLSVNTGGSISGAGNGLRVTLGAGATLPGNASFIRVTNSGSGTITNLFNLPDAMVQAIGGTATTATQKIRFVDSAGTAYFLYAIEA